MFFKYFISFFTLDFSFILSWCTKTMVTADDSIKDFYIGKIRSIIIYLCEVREVVAKWSKATSWKRLIHTCLFYPNTTSIAILLRQCKEKRGGGICVLYNRNETPFACLNIAYNVCITLANWYHPYQMARALHGLRPWELYAFKLHLVQAVSFFSPSGWYQAA